MVYLVEVALCFAEDQQKRLTLLLCRNGTKLAAEPLIENRQSHVEIIFGFKTCLP